MSKKTLDGFLAEDLGTEAARALGVWAGLRESTFALDRWMDNGKSSALVGVVFESNAFTGSRKLILKLDQVDDDAFEKAEFPRHRRALAEVPAAFSAHLAETVYDPVHVGDGRWFTFQRVAAGSLRDVVVVTTLLDDVQRNDGAPRFDTDALTSTCAEVVRSVLTDWAEHADLVMMPVPEFLDHHLGDRLKPGGPLHHLAVSVVEPRVLLPEEPRPLANPFTLALNPTISGGRVVRALLGRSHGDLHTENILMSLRPKVDEPAFFLVDLAKYESKGPLARDPVHLILYVVARSLEGLTPEQREALLGLLVDPGFRGTHLLPGWLVRFIAAIRTEGAHWARRGDLVDEWEEQSLLSLLACSLIMLGRKSTREENRMWFLRLAARSAERYLSESAPNHRGASVSKPRPQAARGHQHCRRARRIRLDRSSVRAPSGRPATRGTGWAQQTGRRDPDRRPARQ